MDIGEGAKTIQNVVDVIYGSPLTDLVSFLPDALHNSSNSPGNATSTTAYGPIYNPAAPPPSTENYLGGSGLGDHESQHALRLAGSGTTAVASLA